MTLSGSRTPQRKVVLVTGSATGIGRATALEFARDGWDVVCHYRASLDKAESLAQSVRELGCKATLVQADLRNPDDIERLLGELDSLRPSSLVNNAGAYLHQLPFGQLTLKELTATFTVNTFAPVLIAARCFEHMAADGGGRIVNVSSVAAKYGGSATSLDYGCAKRALEGVTLTLGREGAARGVLVNTVRPGVIETDFLTGFSKDMTARTRLIPMGRRGHPHEVAKAVHFLGSYENTYMTSQVFAVSGGE